MGESGCLTGMDVEEALHFILPCVTVYDVDDFAGCV